MSDKSYCTIPDSPMKKDVLHCLIMEDNQDFRDMLITFLHRNQIHTDEAENGYIGLHKYLDNAGKYDIILMDLQMPVMDGIETVRSIRSSKSKNAESIPVIAMTGSSISGNLTNIGFTFLIKKPFALADILKCIKRFIKK